MDKLIERLAVMPRKRREALILVRGHGYSYKEDAGLVAQNERGGAQPMLLPRAAFESPQEERARMRPDRHRFAHGPEMNIARHRHRTSA
ncbi:hypothetical protein J2W30_006346 [Variovorax boronicumulans]|nr:hypothetical protein [Variovorax boronicumulans]MDQ0038559.1 hypothetical protein [Variovorax boronicumulans]